MTRVSPKYHTGVRIILSWSLPLLAATIAHLEDARVTESSGVAASRANPGVYWTHNDSGDAPVVYAFGPEGRSLGRWRVRGANALDWEDIAVGPGPKRGQQYLYIGDIGDNQRQRREVLIYRVEEPRAPACKSGCNTSPAAAIRLRYPDGPHNAEALAVHPVTGDLYIVTKTGGEDSSTKVYKARAPLAGGKPVIMQRVATLSVPDGFLSMFVGGITGGDISPDGRRVVLCDYFRAYEAVLPARAAFDAIWRQEFTAIPIVVGKQVEGVCYRADGKAILATAEGKPCPLMDLAAGAR